MATSSSGTGWAVVAHLCALTWIANVPAILPTALVWVLRRRHPGDRPHATAALRFQLAVAIGAALVWLAFMGIGALTGIIWAVPELLLAPYVLVALSIIPSLRAARDAGRGQPIHYPITGAAAAAR